MRSISPCSVRMRENVDQNNPLPSPLGTELKLNVHKTLNLSSIYILCPDGQIYIKEKILIKQLLARKVTKKVTKNFVLIFLDSTFRLY